MTQTPYLSLEESRTETVGQFRQASAELASYVLRSDKSGSVLMNDPVYQILDERFELADRSLAEILKSLGREAIGEDWQS